LPRDALFRPHGTLRGSWHTSIHFSLYQRDKPPDRRLRPAYRPPRRLYSRVSQPDAYALGKTLNFRRASLFTRPYSFLSRGSDFDIYYSAKEV